MDKNRIFCVKKQDRRRRPKINRFKSSSSFTGFCQISKKFIEIYAIFCFRLESYIVRVRETLGFEIIPYVHLNCFTLSFANIDRFEPERRFLCKLKVEESEAGKKTYSGELFNIVASFGRYEKSPIVGELRT